MNDSMVNDHHEPIERRFTSTEMSSRIETLSDGKRIVGYAARFYDGTPETEYVTPKFIERILPGAFNQVLHEGKQIRALFNHDPSKVLGSTKSGTLVLSVDGCGLKYEIELPETATAQEVRALVKRGDVSGASFAFSVTRDSTRFRNEKRNGKSKRVRELVSVAALPEVSIVTFPAYAATTAEARSEELQAEKDSKRAYFRHYAEMLRLSSIVA